VPSQPAPSKLNHIYGARPTAQGVLFVQPDPGEPIAIAGDFNNWTPQAASFRRRPELGVVEAMLSIPPGRYLYRLVVGGQWRADPYNEHCVINEHGESNSVLVVPEAPQVRHEPDT
jgi:1,4-alpha-glucan branching enzyme